MKMRPGDVQLFGQWIGKKIVGWIGDEGDGSTTMSFDDAPDLVCRHFQDCCESVEVKHIPEDFCDILGEPLEEIHSYIYADEIPPGFSREDFFKGREWASESYTITVMVFVAGGKKRILYWLGESNGYYSETIQLDNGDGGWGDTIGGDAR